MKIRIMQQNAEIPIPAVPGITEFRLRPSASATHFAADNLISDSSPLQATGNSYLNPAGRHISTLSRVSPSGTFSPLPAADILCEGVILQTRSFPDCRQPIFSDKQAPWRRPSLYRRVHFIQDCQSHCNGKGDKGCSKVLECFFRFITGGWNRSSREDQESIWPRPILKQYWNFRSALAGC